MESEKRGIFSNHEKRIFPEWIVCRRHAYGMKCQWCGKEFTPLKSWQRYCSPACRAAANRNRLPKDEVHTQEAVLIRSFRCLQ